MSLEPPLLEGRRRRSSSLVEYLKNPGPAHHLNHLTESESDSPSLPRPPAPLPRKRTKTAPPAPPTPTPTNYGPRALQWVQRPSQSFAILASVISFYTAWELLLPGNPNPARPFLFVSYELPHKLGDQDGFVRCQKGLMDLLFLPFYIVAFSFLRQAVTQFVVRPVGTLIGIGDGRKMERFMEQGYAIVYFSASSAAGLYVMRTQDSWWYRTEHFWIGYPHWDMPRVVKTYYLTQFAYWLQQALVMIAGLEKPRDDYIELIIHHIITLWLVGASYLVNLTQIGIAIFVSMDIPDLLLAISKCINYAGLENTGNVSFVLFMLTWGYLRHFENIRILHSVWTQFQLVPQEARVWDPAKGYFLPDWMRYQIFIPILALQLVIAFWSFLILRIVVRMFAGKSASDVREENEGGTGTETEDDVKATARLYSVSLRSLRWQK
ncbi:hypothetical protein RQP46_009549 [Phenoliferia psychrophenolica]